METTEGTVVAGRYRLGPALGEGGMGRVLSATDTESGAKVAIKFLRAELLGHGRNAHGRFQRELRAVTGLQSRHVAKVLTGGELPDGTPYIVMEHLEGKDLARLLAERTRLPAEEVAEYVLQACVGLAVAHAAGIVHRDLKPANLFATVDPEDPGGMPVVKVLDFGVSKIIEPDEDDEDDGVITHVTEMLGSPAYMAPEQLLSARDADARSDIYSLGVILYRLVTGELPIKARSLREHVDCLVRGDMLRPRELVSDLPQAMEDVILCCLEKKRESRYQEVSQLARALAPLAGEKAPASLERLALIERAPPLPSPPPPVEEDLARLPARVDTAAARRGRSSTGRLVLFALVLAVLGAGVGALVAGLGR